MNNQTNLAIEQTKYFDLNRFENIVYEKRKIKVVSIKKRKRERLIDKIFVISAIMLTIATFAFSFFILSRKLSLLSKNNKVVRLETTLNAKILENDQLKSDVKNKVDREYIRNMALVNLSMHEPSEKDIIYFNKSNTSYVRQYDDVK